MRFLRYFAGLSLLHIATSNGFAAERVARPAQFDVPGIDAFLAAQVKERAIPALSIAIVRNGKLVLAKAYGQSSLERRQPANLDTAFAIGSVTKQFTSACILLLAEDGKLSVQDKVSKYFPDLTKANDISLLDLMHHVSGYPDYYPLDFLDRRMAEPISPEKLLREYAQGKLDFEPGTRWSYSNTGYNILGLVVEKVAGEPFGAFSQRRIFRPLGLHRTVYDPERGSDAMAEGYSSFALGPPEVAKPEGKGWVAAAGAIWSTPTDLARWDLALMDRKILKEESFKLMTTPRVLPDGRVTGYGCGVTISLRNGVTVVSHNGMVSGFSAHNSMIPATRSALVLLSNSEFLTGPLHTRILALLTKAHEDSPKIAGQAAVEAAKTFFRQLQSGKIDRRNLGVEFNHLLSDERLRQAAQRLKPFGQPARVELDSISERGGMEVANLRFVFKSERAVKALMYRAPDAKIEEFLILRE